MGLQKKVETRWINRFKARLVAKDFKQKADLDFFDIFSPVTRITSIRLLIAIAAIFYLKIHQMDVKTTFLNKIGRAHV